MHRFEGRKPLGSGARFDSQAPVRRLAEAHTSCCAALGKAYRFDKSLVEVRRNLGSAARLDSWTPFEAHRNCLVTLDKGGRFGKVLVEELRLTGFVPLVSSSTLVGALPSCRGKAGCPGYRFGSRGGRWNSLNPGAVRERRFANLDTAGR